MTILTDKTVLLVGGAGSIGSALARHLVKTDVQAIRVFDIDEHGLWTLKQSIKSDKLRLIVGDVLDRERVKLALKGVDYIIHLAARKNLDITEHSQADAARVNIDGVVNLTECCLDSGVKKFLFISSDKSVNPTTVYGAAKLIGERLTLWADSISQGCRYSVARFGNVYEARGNVFNVWKMQRDRGEPVTLTDPEATRYFWHVKDAVAFMLECLEKMNGGEVFIPKMSEVKMKDLAYKVTGLRKHEKMHEELMTAEEKAKAVETPNSWIVK